MPTDNSPILKNISDVMRSPVLLPELACWERPLDIDDQSLETRGMTNQIFVDRLNLLDTGLDQVKALENKAEPQKSRFIKR